MEGGHCCRWLAIDTVTLRQKHKQNKGTNQADKWGKHPPPACAKASSRAWLVCLGNNKEDQVAGERWN